MDDDRARAYYADETCSGNFFLCWSHLFSVSRLNIDLNTVNKYADGWMTSDLTSFSTVFQSYQDDGWIMMKAVCNRTPFTVESLPRAGFGFGTARS